MIQFLTKRLLGCLAVLLLLWPSLASAAPFTPGNLVVVRIGDGSAALTSAATATFLLEYTPAGVLVQTIALPTAASGANSILTNSGTSSSDALLTRSVDGRYLVLTGYDAPVGLAAVAGTASTANSRIIGRIAADGTFDTSTRLSDGFSGGNIRSATSVDGTAFYAVGSTSGVRFAPLGNASTSTVIAAVPANNRGVGIYGGNLYVSSSTGSGGSYYGVSQVGTGLPTTAGQTTVLLPGFPTTVSSPAQSPYGFYFADLSTSVPGVDVVYVADDRAAPDGGIQKWSLVGSTWTLNGTITGATVRGLNGSVSGNTVALVASGASTLYLLTDNAGYNAAPSTLTAPAVLVTAVTNTSFRGSAFAPAASATPAPTIASFTPTSALVGATVTVTGTNFTGATALTLNGAAVTGFTVVNATTITFTVPTGASSGAIAVTTAGGTATSSTSFTVTAPNPVPTITSLTPNTAVAGSATFTLTVNGTGFVTGSVVNFNGTALATTFISATQLTAAVSASAVAATGSYDVTVTSPAPGGGTSAAAVFTVTTPAPTITSFTPTSGAAGATVTITGTDFTGATAVTLNGVAITGFTVVNATTITFTVPTGASSGAIVVTTPTGTATSSSTFTVIVPNTAPVITSISPATAVAGSAAFTLTVNGTGFVTGAVVNFNGVVLTTTFVSATQVTAAVPASAVATAGAYSVTATNPSPGGGTSAGVTFTVTTPAPTITSFTPTSGAAGAAVTITGANFTGATVVTLNGATITGFTVVNATTITFTVPTGASSGTIAVTTPGGTATSTASFTFLPAPTIASFTPTSGPAGATVTITGTNLTGATVVTLNGATITGFTVVNATTITFTVPTGASSGTIAVTTAGGTATSTGTFTFVPAPTIVSFTPASGLVGSSVTVTGTNFTGATGATLNGVPVANFMVMSSTSVMFTVPAGATSGAIVITTPGGTATSATSFTVVVPATPTITSLSPARAVVGGPAFVLTIGGTNLTATTQVTFRGQTYTAATVNPGGTSITVNIPASAIATLGQFTVTATNGGTASGTLDFAVVAAPTTVAFEDFEQGNRISYTDVAPVVLRSGTWTFTQALIGDMFNDRVNQARSARVRGGGSIAMNFDKPNGAGIVTISAGLYGSDTGATFTAEVSTDGGATYQPIAGTPTTLTNVLTAYPLTVNRTGNIRLRFSSTNATVGANPRISLDDLKIANFTGSATAASQAMPGLAVFPNPATDRLTVALPQAGAATVALRDLTGRLVLAPAALAADQQLRFPVGLAAGAYLLEVHQAGVTAVRRVEKY